MLLYINYHSALMQCTMERGKRTKERVKRQMCALQSAQDNFLGHQCTNWLPNGMLTFCARVDLRSGTKGGLFAYTIPHNRLWQNGFSNRGVKVEECQGHNSLAFCLTYYYNHIFFTEMATLCYFYALALYFLSKPFFLRLIAINYLNVIYFSN